MFLLEGILLPVTLPALAGLVCLLLPGRNSRLREGVALLAAVGTLVACLPLFTRGGNYPVPGNLVAWLRADNLSGLILLGTAVFTVAVLVYSFGFMAGNERLNEYYAYLLWTLAASCGAVLANHLVLLLCFWGFLGFTLYMLMGLAGPPAADAAKKTFVIIGGSDCLLLLGVALIWKMTGTFRMDAEPIGAGTTIRYSAFLCLAAAAFAKAGVVPLHTWVPDCGAHAPIPVTAFLPASLDKLLGIYLLVRITTTLFVMDALMAGFLLVVGAVTILGGVLMALVQHDMKRLLSYHAVSQVGYMVLGIGTGTAVGLAGALFHMLNHATYKSCLFLCAGAVEKEAGTTDLDRLGGLARRLPLVFGAFLVASLAISGVPPLNGFASKWMVYQGVVRMARNGGWTWIIWLAAAMLGSALTLASFVKILHAVFLRKPAQIQPRQEKAPGMAFMTAPIVFLAAVCVLFGVMAVSLPLRFGVFPAVLGSEGELSGIGMWHAGTATLMLLAGLLAGVIVYYVTTVRRARECETYVGGEILDDAHVTGTLPGPDRDLEVTGVDFYRNVEGLWPLSSCYRAARKHLFDLYDVGSHVLFYFVGGLRRAHTGRLPLYLTWVLIGLLVLVAAFIGDF